MRYILVTSLLLFSCSNETTLSPSTIPSSTTSIVDDSFIVESSEAKNLTCTYNIHYAAVPSPSVQEICEDAGGRFFKPQKKAVLIGTCTAPHPGFLWPGFSLRPHPQAAEGCLEY